MGRRIVVGISGASGAVYGIRLLEALRAADVETHLVVSQSGKRAIAEETDHTLKDVRALADVVHPSEDVGAPISSGSFSTMGMVVAPCSVRSLAEIAYGNTTGLLTRAADVALKERRRVVLLVRETPLRITHLRAMAAAAEDGAVIMPPLPAFYTRPTSLAEVVDHTVGRVLDQFGIDSGLVRRWTGSRA
ncbi:UbiX family flavin prenyltransferase [Streptomonospora sp. S1-112]|uniref:Flavin prenyltransferase UbiX n=1 Tax=Streptomonospora mangrovi TaxID=2883123 RepID=A0A9X3SP32_9ACTN|nr:UbiX family flavin prenyltransferase [Streptomonospora mangrovi]MDA0565436.1 UbiX family flavin prenyltransferase [Streptomonospora mangrovi]